MGEAWAEPPPALWQWEHRNGWRDYDQVTCERIEAAYKRGLPYVRTKNGKMKQTPMEMFFVDMIQHDPITGNQRIIRRTRRSTCWEVVQRKLGELVHSVESGRKYRMRFEQYAEARKEILKDLDTKEYNETSFYHETGCCARIATHPAFTVCTMLGVILNTLWLGIDANFNPAAIIWQADIGFQLVEHSFSILFTAELVIRFGALRLKRLVFQDGWLIFDTVLVAIMVGENLVMLPVYLANRDNPNAVAFGDISILRLARLLRLTRLSRVARLLRNAPEVLTMLRGVAHAFRTVFVTAMLLLVLVYLFGIIFKIQAKSYPELTRFPSVDESMWALLLHGTFLDAVAEVVYDMKDISYILTFIFMVFVFLSNLTILNMLVGILCEVATDVAKREKEQAAVSYLKQHLLEFLEVHDKNDDRHIGKEDFELLLRNPEMCLILANFGVDTEDLLSLQDVLFETKVMVDQDEGPGTKSTTADLEGSSFLENKSARSSTVFQCQTKRLRFAEFLEVVLRLRGGNGASVRDIVDLREYLRERMDHMERQLRWSSPSAESSPLRAAATEGHDGSRQAVTTLLQQLTEVREDLRVMRGQVQRLEGGGGGAQGEAAEPREAAEECPSAEITRFMEMTPSADSAEFAADF